MLVAVELSPNPQTSIPMSNKRQAVHKHLTPPIGGYNCEIAMVAIFDSRGRE